jgi:hypothetical protein
MSRQQWEGIGLEEFLLFVNSLAYQNNTELWKKIQHIMQIKN